MKSAPDIAVIGHTNAGKTSLMRTLTRQRDFGRISAHPATTRHVELAELAVAGQAVLRLYDTPGFEDSSGLLAHLEHLKASRGEDWIETIEAFVRDPALQSGFGQEAKALNQILASDILLYVVDVRDPVRAKHRDELEVIARCARPVLPVLNFLTRGDTREAAWREQLARVNMHAIVAFDTVVYREADELALYGKMATLSDAFATPLKRLMAELKEARSRLRQASARVVAELVVDVAAARRRYPADSDSERAATADALKEAVRRREREAVAALLELHRFTPQDYAPDDLPFSHGEWQEDLFDPEVLGRFTFDTAAAAVTGATAGLAIDLMTGGLTLGIAALTGATAGLVLDGARRYGGRALARLRGLADMSVADATLHLLAAREAALVTTLLGRGHGAVTPIRAAGPDAAGDGWIVEWLAPLLKQARRNPRWSVLDEDAPVAASSRRNTAIERITAVVSDALAEPDGAALPPPAGAPAA